MCVFVFCTLTMFSHYLLTSIVSAEKPAFNLSCCSRFCPCLQVSMLLVYNVYLWISTFILPAVCWASWKYAAAAKSLQSCPTLCDPRDSSPPASPSLGFSRQEHWSGVPLPSPVISLSFSLFLCKIDVTTNRFVCKDTETWRNIISIHCMVSIILL